MGIFRDLSKLIPDKGARSIVRKVGRVADKAISHGVYEADRAAFFAEAERTGERTTPAEFPVLPTTLAELSLWHPLITICGRLFVRQLFLLWLSLLTVKIAMNQLP